MKQNSIKALSIQIRLSGLSFCILNRTTHTIELLQHVHLEKKATPFELLNDLKVILASNSDFEQTFDTITCIYQNELSCLVPETLFDENNLADYLKFNAKILKTDFISYDTLPTNKSVNVYVPLININNYIFDTFGSFVYKHASTILIETLLQANINNEDRKLYINVGITTFEIVSIDKEKLVFYNTFEYNTKEDFIYYVLFTVEQLKLNPETINAILTGQIQDKDELYTILYTYIRHVSFEKNIANFKFDSDIKIRSNHSDFIILNSFS